MVNFTCANDMIKTILLTQEKKYVSLIDCLQKKIIQRTRQEGEAIQWNIRQTIQLYYIML